MAKALFTATTENGKIDLVGPDGHGGSENTVWLLLRDTEESDALWVFLDTDQAENLGKKLLTWSESAR